MTFVCEGAPQYGDLQFKIINDTIHLVVGNELQALPDHDIYLGRVIEIR